MKEEMIMTQQLIRKGRHEGTITGVSLNSGDDKAYVDILIHTSEGIDHKWSMTLNPAHGEDLGYRLKELKDLGWDGVDIEQLATQTTGKPIAFGIDHKTSKDGRIWAKTFISNTPSRELKPLSKGFAATLNKAFSAAAVSAPATEKVSPIAAKAAAAKAAARPRPAPVAETAELDENF